MKIIKIIYFVVVNILVMNLVLVASEKPVDEDALFKVDKNIKSKKIKSELTFLKQEFESERSKIKKIYNKEIEILRHKKQNELKALRKEFKEKRDKLLKKNDKKSKKNNKKSIIKSKK